MFARSGPRLNVLSLLYVSILNQVVVKETPLLLLRSSVRPRPLRFAICLRTFSTFDLYLFGQTHGFRNAVSVSSPTCIC